MMVQERIVVLVTKAQKRRLAARAAVFGLSAGEFLRQAGDAYISPEDEALLAGLLSQVSKAAMQSACAIDDALAFVARSEKRLGQLVAGRNSA